jgi:NADPH:quinone reductase-like Zn-dependent oxidoreductase
VKVRGWDVAGTVEAVGAGATSFKPGDEVYGTARGTFAEYVCAKDDRIAPKPANLTFEEAAAVPTAAITALQGLRDKGGVQAGQKVLVFGAGGGVGSFAVQVARAYGAEVTGVCSTAKVDLVRSLGADTVIDYTREDVQSSGQRYDIILDNGGNRRLADMRRMLVPEGRTVLVGGEDGGAFWGGMGRNIQAMVQSMFMKQKQIMLVANEKAVDLEALTQFIEAGKVTVAIDRTYPLAQTADAMRQWEARTVKGKVVVTV